MQKTLRSFPSTGRTGYFSVLLEPHNPVCAQETVTLNSLRRASCKNTFERTKGSLRASRYPFPSTTRPGIPSPPGAHCLCFPLPLGEPQPVAKRGQRKGYFYSTPKTSLHGTRCFKNQHPKRHEMGFLCVLSFLVWQIEVLRNDRRLFMFTSPKSGSRTSLEKAKQVMDHPRRACTLRS